MKLIIAIVPSYRMENVIEELDKVKVFRKTVTNVLGVGRPQKEVYRGLKETGNLVQKVRFEVAVNDSNLNTTITAIRLGAHNENGDGKIFVINLEDCIQIGTNKSGNDAIGQ